MADLNDLSPELTGEAESEKEEAGQLAYMDEEELKATATQEGAGTDEATPMEEEAVATDNDTATEMDYPKEDK